MYRISILNRKCIYRILRIFDYKLNCQKSQLIRPELKNNMTQKVNVK